MTRPVRITVLTIVLCGCSSEGPALIGSAYPIADSQPSVIGVARDALDSADVHTPVRVTGWSQFGFNVDRHAEQAELFADNPDVVAVVGHGGSRDALIGAAIYNVAGVPQVVPTATSRRLQAAGPWTFMMVPNDSVVGDYIAAWAVDSAGAKRVAVLYVGDEYGIGIREGVRLGLQARGLDLVDDSVLPGGDCQVPGRGSVIAPVVRAAIQRSRPDAIVIAASAPSGWCAIQHVHAEDRSIWILAGDGVEVGARASESGYDPARVRGVGFWRPGTDSANIAFVARTERILGRRPSAGEALQYDAFMLLHQAVQEAGPDRRKIRAWLESLGRSGPAWVGVTGPVSFDRPRVDLLHMDRPGFTHSGQ